MARYYYSVFTCIAWWDLLLFLIYVESIWITTWVAWGHKHYFHSYIKIPVDSLLVLRNLFSHSDFGHCACSCKHSIGVIRFLLWMSNQSIDQRMVKYRWEYIIYLLILICHSMEVWHCDWKNLDMSIVNNIMENAVCSAALMSLNNIVTMVPLYAGTNGKHMSTLTSIQ